MYTYGTDETRVSLQVEIEGVRMGDLLVDDETCRLRGKSTEIYESVSCQNVLR